jgi:ATP diphosphatase
LSKIEKLRAIMAELRHPERGCPWDLKQRFDTIVPHTLEEAYEVAEAIETGDLAELRDELGDLLFQIVFYARLAEEQGAFDFDAVVDAIVDKLVRRHPHVFADAEAGDTQALGEAWEAGKAAERAHKHGTGTLAGVAHSLPAMTRAVKLQKRAARVGFDWPDILPVFDKIEEELEEVRLEIQQGAEQARIEDEIGDLFFACSNLARHARIDPETALRRANRKFEQRFAHMEALVAERQLDLATLDLDSWESLWLEAKAAES